MTLTMHRVNASEAPRPSGGYSQAVEICRFSRLLFVSGQIPVSTAGEVPNSFRDQCRLVWWNIESQLRAAGLALSHVVKVTTFLADRAYAAENSAVRNEILGTHQPALTVILADIYDPAWLVEIEVIAAE